MNTELNTELKDKLPHKMSSLLRLALADLKSAEKTPGVKIDMNYWLYRPTEGPCLVCLAGATMIGTCAVATTMGAAPRHYEQVSPHDALVTGLLSDNDCDCLAALNCLRTGDVQIAWKHMPKGTPSPDRGYDCAVDGYYTAAPELFHESMEKLAYWLEARGA